MESNRDLSNEMLDKKINTISNQGENIIDAGRFSEFMSEKSTIKRAIDYYYHHGILFYLDKQYDKAMQAFDTVLILDPAHYQAQNNRGLIHVACKNYVKANESFTISIDLFPNPMAYYNRATIYAGQRNHKSTIKDCKQAIILDPRHVNAYHLLAKTYGTIKHWESAIAAYKKCITLKPTHYLYIRDRGNAYENFEKFPEAITDYTLALTLHPKSKSTLQYLNTLLYSINHQHDLSTLDKTILFNAITKLPGNKQLPLLTLCKDETSPFGIIMHKPRHSLVSVITFFDSNPNDFDFIKCDKSKGMLKKIDEQIAAIKKSLHVTGSTEECWIEESSEEEMRSLKSQRI